MDKSKKQAGVAWSEFLQTRWSNTGRRSQRHRSSVARESKERRRLGDFVSSVSLSSSAGLGIRRIGFRSQFSSDCPSIIPSLVGRTDDRIYYPSSNRPGLARVFFFFFGAITLIVAQVRRTSPSLPRSDSDAAIVSGGILDRVIGLAGIPSYAYLAHPWLFLADYSAGRCPRSFEDETLRCWPS